MSFFDMFSSKKSTGFDTMLEVEAAALVGFVFGGQKSMRQFVASVIGKMALLNNTDPFTAESHACWVELHDLMEPYQEILPLLSIVVSNDNKDKAVVEKLFIIAKLRKKYPFTEQQLKDMSIMRQDEE